MYNNTLFQLINLYVYYLLVLPLSLINKCVHITLLRKSLTLLVPSKFIFHTGEFQAEKRHHEQTQRKVITFSIDCI